MKISLVLLVLDEVDGLRTVLPRIPRNAVDEIIAIDGGSTDGSLELIAAQSIPCYSQRQRGRGAAFIEAFERTTGDALIFFSPDGNEDPDDIPKFRPYLLQGYDMVIGTRMAFGGRNEEDDLVLRWRKWANNLFTLAANTLWNRGPYVTDTINGYRALTRGAWETLRLDAKGYTVEYQSSIRGFKKGLRIVEFPTYEGARIGNKPGSPSIATGKAFVKLFLREMLSKN